MEDTLWLLLLAVLIFYGFLLRQKVAHDQAMIATYLKEVVALLHRRADQISMVQADLEKLMPDESVMWQELRDARSTLLQVIIGYDVSQIATADAELNRCLFVMHERIQVYLECQNHEAMSRFNDDIKHLDEAIEAHINTYNTAVDEFERKVNRPPVVFFRFFINVETMPHFMHEPATVADQHIEAVVLE